MYFLITGTLSQHCPHSSRVGFQLFLGVTVSSLSFFFPSPSGLVCLSSPFFQSVVLQVCSLSLFFDFFSVEYILRCSCLPMSTHSFFFHHKEIFLPLLLLPCSYLASIFLSFASSRSNSALCPSSPFPSRGPSSSRRRGGCQGARDGGIPLAFFISRVLSEPRVLSSACRTPYCEAEEEEEEEVWLEGTLEAEGGRVLARTASYLPFLLKLRRLRHQRGASSTGELGHEKKFLGVHLCILEAFIYFHFQDSRSSVL